MGYAFAPLPDRIRLDHADILPGLEAAFLPGLGTGPISRFLAMPRLIKRRRRRSQRWRLAVGSRHDVQVHYRGRPSWKIAAEVLLGLPLVAAVVVMAGRVGATARFVTWSVVAFTILAAMVALVGMWVGLDRPGLLAAGVLPGLMVSYVLPAAPFTVVAGVLVGLAALAVGVRGIAAGAALTVSATMVLAVVLQGPAVECRQSSVSSSSGPWWVASPSSSSGSGTGAAGGGFSGTTQVGDHHYAYACADGRLTRFERVD